MLAALLPARDLPAAVTVPVSMSATATDEQVENCDAREVLDRRVGMPAHRLLRRAAQPHARLVAQRAAARLIWRQQVDQCQVVITRAAAAAVAAALAMPATLQQPLRMSL
eukprot:4670805-Pleurochrysis_carterae.AAC.10